MSRLTGPGRRLCPAPAQGRPLDNFASLTYDEAMSELVIPGRKPERLIRTDTPLPQTIIIGAYLLLVVALPLLFSPDVMHPFGSPKLTALAIAAAGTGRRGAVLGLVIAGLVRLVVRPPKAISRNRRLTAVLLLMAVLIGSFLFFAVSASEAAWLAPLRHLTELDPDTYGMRAQAWEAGAASILDKPFLGTGPETFRRTYLEHLASQPPVNLAGTKLDILGDAHNWVIEFASTYGLPFIFALFALIVLPIPPALHGDALRRGALLASITLWATSLPPPYSLT